MLLDAVLGEPRWLWDRLPHPAVLLGRLVALLDRRLNRGRRRRGRGIVAVVLLVTVAAAVGAAISALPDAGVLELLAVAILLAQRSLVDHVRAVAAGLRHSTAEGRAAVAMIVGRDTAGMDGPAIARAAIESAAENLSDGVIAPAFWYAVAGLPGMLVYKAVNTADSMIGHRTPRHGRFGWAAARFDDLLNWVPARLAALLILLAHGSLRHWREVPRDAALHRSPNAGWPEAALAPVLSVALSGPRSYGGRREALPWVNSDGRKGAGPEDIERAVVALWRTWAASVAVAVVMSLMTFEIGS
jgi:adenosylcobinamide-phosphate synthase